jgi:hypothetical protein
MFIDVFNSSTFFPSAHESQVEHLQHTIDAAGFQGQRENGERMGSELEIKVK